VRRGSAEPSGIEEERDKSTPMRSLRSEGTRLRGLWTWSLVDSFHYSHGAIELSARSRSEYQEAEVSISISPFQQTATYRLHPTPRLVDVESTIKNAPRKTSPHFPS
jgi:hypothetical protein